MGRKHTPQSDPALEELCKTYWFPLYAYVRRRGHSKEDAKSVSRKISEEEFSGKLEQRARTFSRFSARVAIRRLRQRYRGALREELAHTVTTEAEVLEELRELRRILSR